MGRSLNSLATAMVLYVTAWSGSTSSISCSSLADCGKQNSNMQAGNRDEPFRARGVQESLFLHFNKEVNTQWLRQAKYRDRVNF